jgi:hypothetical protein
MRRVSSAIFGLLAAGCCRLGSSPSPGGEETPAAATTTVAQAPPAPQPQPTEPPEPPGPPTPLTDETATKVPCGAKGPRPWPLRNPDLGPWGEDRRTAPDFGYVQERRAPKMPDGGKYLARIPSRSVQQLENALLICHVEVYTRTGHRPTLYRYKLATPDAGRPHCGADWDFFAGPDLLLKLRLRGEHPIALYGPEDHWGMFISVPRVRLVRGDLLEVKLWDRDSSGDSAGANEEDVEYMGYAATTLSGKWPVVLQGPYFMMRCNAMSGAEAEAAGKRWMSALDGTLRSLETLAPDPRKWDFGPAPSAIDQGELSFGEGNFRYAAGFVGWDHPAIVTRRAKVQRILADWPRKRGEAAKAMAKKAPPPGKPIALGGKNGTLRVTGVVCQGGTCTLTAELSPGASPSGPDWKVTMASVGPDGDFHPAALVAADDAPPQAGKPGSYKLELGGSALVLWIQSPAGVHTVKVRDPE